jgi:serine/threonine protein kinase
LIAYSVGVSLELPNVRNASEIQTEIGENPSDNESSSQDEARAVVRQLSPVDVPTYLERVSMADGGARLLVVERIARGAVTDDEAAEYVRDAHAITDLCHPNVVGATSIELRNDEISVASDLVDGERLSELWRAPDGGARPVIPIEIAVKIFIDVLTGLAAIHKLKSDNGERRTRVIHGEVTAANVVVGLDGVARLVRACRVRRPGALPSTGLGTLAPEILSSSHADQHADVFSVGALLWQALSGRPLVADDASLETVLERLQSGEIPPCNIPNDAPWAAPLVDVAARALEAAPEKRFPTATAMVTELRRIAGTSLATTAQVADFVSVAAGERIARRRAPAESSEAKQTQEPQRLYPESGVRRLQVQEPTVSPVVTGSLDQGPTGSPVEPSSLDQVTVTESPPLIESVVLKSAVPTLRPVPFAPEPEPAPLAFAAQPSSSTRRI